MEKRKKVLFLCTHNSARSQMAEGILRELRGEDFEVFSAGTKPSGLNPYAVRVMKEIGIDISHHRSKGIGELAGREFDYVVTVCDRAREACSFFPGGKRYIHRSFPDPSGCGGSEEEKFEAFRKVRDEIRSWILEVFGKETAG